MKNNEFAFMTMIEITKLYANNVMFLISKHSINQKFYNYQNLKYFIILDIR